MKHKWRENARRRGLDIGAVVPVLVRIEQRDGSLTPKNVVDEAKKKRSPLYRWFEWDNIRAASEYRLEQARELIRSVSVVIEGAESEEVEIRAFVQVGEGSEYFDVGTVLSDDEKRAELLRNALRDLRAFEKKYRALKELAAVFAATQDIQVPA